MKRFALLIILASALPAVGQRISDPSVPDLNAADVTDPAKVRLYAADIQASTPGVGKDIGLDQIQLAVQSQVIEATSHGLVSGDVGKPLHGTSIYDDTNSAHRVDWILVQAIDVNKIRVMPMGGVVDVPVSMLQDGSAYNVATSGRYVYWDASVGDYVPVKPADAVEESVPVLVVMHVGLASFRAVVALRGPSNSTDTITIRGTGVAAIDNARFAAAVSTLNARGRGAVEIVGKCVLTASHNFLAPVSIHGRLGSDPEIEMVDNANIGWNRSYSIFSQPSKKISPTAASASTLEVPGGFLAAGDWFCVLADDVLTGFSFSPSLEHSPAEVHQVKEFRATSSPQSFTVDAGTDICTSQSHHLDNSTVVTVATSGTFPGGLTAGEYYVRDSNYVTGMPQPTRSSSL
jgi:hypothetical protein